MEPSTIPKIRTIKFNTDTDTNEYTLNLIKNYQYHLPDTLNIDYVPNPVSGGSKKIYKINGRKEIFSFINQNKESLKQLELEFDLQNEFNSGCNDPNTSFGVPKIYEFGIIKNKSDEVIDYYAIMESGGNMDLFDYISLSPFPIQDMKQLILLFINILKSVYCIHEKNYVHLDLKPENIMIDSTTINKPEGITVKLIDFGHSLLNLSQHSGSVKGTAFYISPQWFDYISTKIKKKDSQPSLKVLKCQDIFGLAIIFLILLSLFIGSNNFPCSPDGSLSNFGCGKYTSYHIELFIRQNFVAYGVNIDNPLLVIIRKMCYYSLTPDKTNVTDYDKSCGTDSPDNKAYSFFSNINEIISEINKPTLDTNLEEFNNAKNNLAKLEQEREKKLQDALASSIVAQGKKRTVVPSLNNKKLSSGISRLPQENVEKNINNQEKYRLSKRRRKHTKNTKNGGSRKYKTKKNKSKRNIMRKNKSNKPNKSNKRNKISSTIKKGKKKGKLANKK